MKLNQYDIDDVKANNLCEDVLRENGIKVDRYGHAVCPFHGDKNASMKIYRKTNTCHCFGCGWDGDVISLTMAFNGLDFEGAYKYLGGRVETRDKAEEERLERKHERLETWRKWIKGVKDKIEQLEMAVTEIDWEIRDLDIYDINDELVALDRKRMKLFIEIENYKESLKMLERELDNEKSKRDQ